MRMLIVWIVALMTSVLALPLKVVYAQAKAETPASKSDATKPELVRTLQLHTLANRVSHRFTPQKAKKHLFVRAENFLN
jgi:hypothetical protein